MTIDEVMADAARQLDEVIASELSKREARLRQDLAESGPEDEEALDRPPDPDSPWRRITVEEVMMIEAERMQASRAEALANIRRGLEKKLHDQRTTGGHNRHGC